MSTFFHQTSSLGDVIHHMPALTEAQRQRPDARFAWLVEEAFAPLVRLHPAVAEVIPVAWRRWRKSLVSPATLAEIAGSLRAIRSAAYDEIVDSQGLLRSALIARVAHGRRHGYDRSSIREPLASAFYDIRHGVSRELHAVERNRILSGLALGYTPQGAPDFGLDRARLAGSGPRYAVLLHATARTTKEWPREHWIALGKALGPGVELVLPWGTQTRARRSRPSPPRCRARTGARAGAARRGRPPDRRRAIRGQGRHRAHASRRRSACRWWRSCRQQSDLTARSATGRSPCWAHKARRRRCKKRSMR